MTLIKSEREKAKMCALAAVRTKYPSGQDTWVGPTMIDFEVRTSRVFKDHLVLGGSLKHVQDGVCLAVLPLGDGPKTPYRWNMPSQVRVKRRADEGVLVTIRSLDYDRLDRRDRDPIHGQDCSATRVGHAAPTCDGSRDHD